MLGRFASAAHLDQRAFELLRDLGPRHDQGAAAIAHHTAIEPVQRVRDHRRVHYVFHRHHVAQHGVRIVLGVMGRRHLDPRQLLAGGTELVHMALGNHAVEVLRGRAEGQLEGKLRRVGIGRFQRQRGTGGAWPACQRNQRYIAAASSNGLRRVRNMQDGRRAAALRGVDVPHLEPKVLDHCRGAQAWCIASAEIAIDVALAQAGVFQRALGDVRVQPYNRQFIGLAGGMLVRPHDISASVQTHGVLEM